jgi:outer membrane lipoprotein-sorting protein
MKKVVYPFGNALKKKPRLNLLLTFLFPLLIQNTHAALLTPAESLAIVKNAEDQILGDTFQGQMTMNIRHTGNERSLVMKIWTSGRDKATIKILQPQKERDSGNLRLNLNFWQYAPKIDKMIKIPPSMMIQSWMGSDFTNDDLVKSSSLARDYTHVHLKNEPFLGRPAYVIEATPKKDAPITWGKLLIWIDTKEGVPVKEHFFTESGELVKILEGREIKRYGKRAIPTHITMINQRKSNATTVMIYEKVTFDAAIPASVFTQEFLRKPER